MAFWVTLRFGRLAGGAVFLALLVASFIVIRPLYAQASHCDGVFVPGWIAFTVACGTWPAIYCGGEKDESYHTLYVALLSVLHSLVPGVAVLLMLWPCR